jgi:hypothetical protein
VCPVDSTYILLNFIKKKVPETVKCDIMSYPYFKSQEGVKWTIAHHNTILGQMLQIVPRHVLITSLTRMPGEGLSPKNIL